MRNVIVTGAGGFVGSWLVLELLKNDIRVTVIARNKKKLMPEILRNEHCLVIEKEIEELIPSDFKPAITYDAFYHLAWNGVTSERKNDIGVQLKNIPMSVHAMQICKDIGCKHFIVTGTVAEYALSTDVINVNTKQTPNDIYGATKVSAHFFLEILSRQLEIAFNWVVLSSVYGERRTDNNIIAYTINELLMGKKPQYGDLHQMWDFLYAADAARALRLIGEKGIPGKTYGIGSGVYRPLREYIQMIRDIINPDLVLGIGESPDLSQQTVSACVNIFDLTKDTGFAPEVSFEVGIKNMIHWMQKDKDRQNFYEE